jgi:hypothetical protein
MKITIDPTTDSNGFFTLRPSDGSPHGDTDEQPIATVFDESNAKIIAFVVTACHGLDLPVNVSPGALAEIVTAARVLLNRAIDGLDQSATHDGMKNCQAIARLRAALAKLDPPEPYGYAVKTAEGYVANQGDQWWQESEPVGWSLFGTREGAESIAGLRGGEVVPVFKR